MKRERAITLISLVITIIVLIILASVAIYLSLGNNGIFMRVEQAKEETNKQTATEKINLKITTAQINSYSEKQEMPTLKELSLALENDDEIAYVTESSQIASTKYEVGDNPTSIFTKLKEYPYEFEINSSLQLASINGVKVATTNNSNDYSLEETKTNETWLKKPIYRKVIYIEQLPNAQDGTYNHGIENIETVWINNAKSFFRSEDRSSGTIPYTHVININGQISAMVNKTHIIIETRTNRSSWDAYITLEYTKTTDKVN